MVPDWYFLQIFPPQFTVLVNFSDPPPRKLLSTFQKGSLEIFEKFREQGEGVTKVDKDCKVKYIEGKFKSTSNWHFQQFVTTYFGHMKNEACKLSTFFRTFCDIEDHELCLWSHTNPFTHFSIGQWLSSLHSLHCVGGIGILNENFL